MGDRLERDGLESDRASSLEAGDSFDGEFFVPERELFFAIKHLIFDVPERHRMSVYVEPLVIAAPKTGNFYGVESNDSVKKRDLSNRN